MHTVRLLVCIVLVVPVTSFVDRASRALLTERPLFRSSAATRVGPRVVAIGAVLLVVYVLTAQRFEDSSWLELFAYLALFAVLLLASIVDLEEYRLPDVLVLPAIGVAVVVIGVASALDGSAGRLRFAVLGGAVAFAVLLVAHLVSPRGMGFGDVKFAALLGLAVGWQAGTAVESLVLVLWMLLIGFGIGSVAGVVLWVVRRGNAPFPFGPFLALGTVATVLSSPVLIG